MEKNNLPWIVAIGAILLVAFVIYQQQQPAGDGVLRDTITVNGVAELKVEPDKAEIWILVEGKGSDAASAQEDLQEKSNKVLTSVKAQGVLEKDIETTGFSVYPDYQYNPETGESTIVGYRAQHSLKVTVHELEKAGVVADAIGTQNGQVQNIQFGLTDEAQKRYDDEALQLAAADARKKAESLTSAVGARLGKVVAIQESNVYYPPWPMYARADMMIAEGGFTKATEVLPGPVSVSSTVSVTYALG
ncbi:SIMPL domain-containing protein [Candidatus Woesearchaeota archaeon]|nr:SIMPL domain-containing protein [Candidatus Woesearchaeota archaeon]